ncbi:MAG: COQ9 family protein [Hyphomicrobiales bacterium]|nr:COQ9 family protein [Hyphomicrobiales bacterium]
MKSSKEIKNSRESQLLDRFLAEAPFGGWQLKTLKTASKQCFDEPNLEEICFPAGLKDVTLAFADRMDAEMTAAFRQQEGTLRVRDKVSTCVWLRLQAMQPYRESVRSLMGWLALPGNHLLAMQLMARTVDTIWHLCGDTATDFNYYSKRALLAGVYGSTLLYWLNDTSEGYADTHAFLQRRIADVMRIQTTKKRVQEFWAKTGLGKKKRA